MRMRDARLPVTLLAVALTALTVWSLRHFGQYQPLLALGGPPVTGALGRVGLQIQGATVTGRQDGRRRWRVECRLITLSRDRRQVRVDGIERGILYDASEKPAVKVRAAHADFVTLGGALGGPLNAGGTLHLTGGIGASLQKRAGFSLQSDRLTWDALRNQIVCPGAVTARFPGGVAVGQNVTVDIHTGDLTLRTLHGTFRLPPEVLEAMFPKTSPRTALLLGGALGLSAVSSSAPIPSKTPEGVDYAANFSRWLNAPRTIEMSQGVTFTQGDSVVKTDAAVVNLDDRQRALNAKSQAPVHLYNPQDDLTGRQGFIDFNRHIATLSGNILLVIKPGPREAGAAPSSLRSRFKDAATVTCGAMTYDYRRKVGRIPGPLTVHQKDRVLTADSGVYDSRAQTVILAGNVHGHNGDSEIQASQVVFGLKEGAESITIPVPTHGHWAVKADDDPTTPPAPTSSASAPPPSVPGPKS